ncbi:MAG: hypothetical protein HYX63_12495 [Gammaproteobacteria bacterium]|nr:hypothetical protein [Gammaproteobacteria bacterium]
MDSGVPSRVKLDGVVELVLGVPSAALLSRRHPGIRVANIRDPVRIGVRARRGSTFFLDSGVRRNDVCRVGRYDDKSCLTPSSRNSRSEYPGSSQISVRARRGQYFFTGFRRAPE